MTNRLPIAHSPKLHNFGKESKNAGKGKQSFVFVLLPSYENDTIIIEQTLYVKRSKDKLHSDRSQTRESNSNGQSPMGRIVWIRNRNRYIVDKQWIY